MSAALRKFVDSGVTIEAGADNTGCRGGAGRALLIGAAILAASIAAAGGLTVQGAGVLAWIPLAGYLTLPSFITVIATYTKTDPSGRRSEPR